MTGMVKLYCIKGCTVRIFRKTEKGVGGCVPFFALIWFSGNSAVLHKYIKKKFFKKEKIP